MKRQKFTLRAETMAGTEPSIELVTAGAEQRSTNSSHTVSLAHTDEVSGQVNLLRFKLDTEIS